MTSRNIKTPGDEVLATVRKWFDQLKLYGGFPAKGTISGALVILDRLKAHYDLDIDSHTTAGGSQVSGASGTAGRRILDQFGETRPFLAEGGRTNRGLRGDVKNLLRALNTTALAKLDAKKRSMVLRQCQCYLVERVRDFHNRQRLKFVYDKNRSTRQSIIDILTVARSTAKEGPVALPVAQYLVGAKLKLRFPGKDIENKSYSTADAPQDRPGDFLVGSSAFHVTIAPTASVFTKCQRNIQDGLRAYLLVPDKLLQGARQNAELTVVGPIDVEPIESFIAQNVLEVSEFSDELLPKQFLRLLQIYNERVDGVELDKSMLIEIPKSLQRGET